MIAVDVEIEKRLHDSTETDVLRARDAARHLVLAGGKRVRPRLAMLVAEAAGLDADTARIIGTAAELVHSATLLHDDVIDRSDQRRGQITVNAKYGAGSAILTGDFLLAQALSQLLDAELYLATREMSKAVRELAEAEILQLQQAFDAKTSFEQTRRVATGKTGALFSWCARGVAVSAGLPRGKVDTASEVGRSIGYAFQIADDLLDFIPSRSGKPAHKDMREGQVTVPMQLLRRHDPVFDTLLVRAFTTREETDFAIAYDVLQSGPAELLGRMEITEALAQARAALDSLAGSPETLAKFDAFIHDCTKRME